MSDTHFGIHFPAGQQRHSNALDYARHIDALGYDSIWVIENLGSGSAGLECLTTLGYFAASAPRLAIGTSVLLLPLRNPVLLAQAAASLQVLSDGKLILGVGVGAAEHAAAVGVDPTTRGRRCEEWLTMMRRLWTGQPVSFEGEFVSLDGYALGPVPEKPPALWIGGRSPAAEKRAVRHADAYIPTGAAPAEYSEIFSRIDRHAEELGRENKMSRTVHMYVGLADTREEAAEIASGVLTERYRVGHMAPRPAPHLFGTPDDCLATLAAFRAAGVTDFVLDPACRPEDTESQVTRLMREIIEPLRRAG